MRWACGGVSRPECQECRLYQRGTHPFIPPVVERPGVPVDLAIVGEAPGAREDDRGEYFVGKAGELLDRFLDASPWRGANVGFFNAVQCWPGRDAQGDAKPSMDQVRACRPLLLENLQRARPLRVLAMGQWAGRALTDDGRLTVGGKHPSRLRALSIPGWEGHPPLTVTYHPAAVFRVGPSLEAVILGDLERLYADMTGGRREVPGFVRLAPADLAGLGGARVALDTEFNPTTGEVYSVAVYDGILPRAAAIQRTDAEHPPEAWRTTLSSWLAAPGLEIVGHNLTADLHALARFGVQLPGFVRLRDSLTRARVAWENDPDRSLETLAQVKLGFTDYAAPIQPYKRTNPGDFGAVAPLDVLLGYNVGDAVASWALHEALDPLLPPALLSLLDRAEYDLALASWDGQQVDGETLKRLQRKYRGAVSAALGKLRKLVGKKDFNPRDKEGASYPWKTLQWKPLREGKEGPSLDEHTLLHYRETGPSRSRAYAAALLEFRHAATRLGRLDKDFTNNRDAQGVVHALFNTAAARTLRDSSKSPNYQNVTPELRELVVSRWKGGRITHADLRGLEPRVMAHLTGCKTLIELFRDPQRAGKVYEILGSDILGQKVQKVDSRGRKTLEYNLAKEVILATNYNAVARTLCQSIYDKLGVRVEESKSQRWIDTYLRICWEIKAYIWEKRRQVWRNQEVRCATGFVRHLPNDGPGDYRGTPEEQQRARTFKHAWNQAVNVDTQHTAAMIAKLWGLYVQRDLRCQGLLARDRENRALDVTFLGPVHDSLSHDTRTKALAQAVAETYVRALGAIQGNPVRALIGERLAVPLDCEVEVGLTWRFS